MTTTADVSPRFKARIAGFFYILMIPIGAIPSIVGRLNTSGDAAATAADILAHPSLVHCAFAVDLLVIACYIPVTALLYGLFKPVNRTLSLTAAFFSLVGCIVQTCATLFRIAPLVLLTSIQSSGIKRDQVVALAYLLLKLYKQAYSIGLVFFGFYLVLIGCLIFKSTFMPRLLGVLVVIAGIGGLTFLWPPLAPILWPRVILSLWAGEGLLILWLLIVGVNAERWHERARAAKE